MKWIAAVVLAAVALQDPAKKKAPGYDDTPVLPDGKWKVHDSKRPHPPIVTPGTSNPPETPGKPPSDAIVLFDGTDLSKWKSAKGDAAWKIENGYMEANKSGDVTTRSVDMLVARLRKKLKKEGTRWIETVQGYGYRIPNA